MKSKFFIISPHKKRIKSHHKISLSLCYVSVIEIQKGRRVEDTKIIDKHQKQSLSVLFEGEKKSETWYINNRYNNNKFSDCWKWHRGLHLPLPSSWIGMEWKDLSSKKTRINFQYFILSQPTHYFSNHFWITINAFRHYLMSCNHHILKKFAWPSTQRAINELIFLMSID